MSKSLEYFSCYKKVITLAENRAQEQHKPNGDIKDISFSMRKGTKEHGSISGL